VERWESNPFSPSGLATDASPRFKAPAARLRRGFTTTFEKISFKKSAAALNVPKRARRADKPNENLRPSPALRLAGAVLSSQLPIGQMLA
jgi:hypothetical protein